ncbi:MAG: hypothetical protein HQL60_01050 [Magnetococcales bacterium]|nr:hypothetical protein [Magnetococcales bacterium]
MSNCSTPSGVIRIDAALLRQRQQKTGVRPLSRLSALFDVALVGQPLVCSQLPLWFVEQMGQLSREICLVNSVHVSQTATRNSTEQRNMARRRSNTGRNNSRVSHSTRNKAVSIPHGWAVTNGAIACSGIEKSALFQSKRVIPRVPRRAIGEQKLSGVATPEGMSVAWELHRTIVNGSETTLLIPVAASMEVKKRL